MKGVILDCLKKTVVTGFGETKWLEIMEQNSLNPRKPFLASSDIDDGVSTKLIESTCTILGISMDEAAQAFGEVWMAEYASKIYAPYIIGIKSTRELLLQLDKIHDRVTKNIPNARPPRFKYSWENEKTLIIHYESSRNLLDLFIGLAKSVGKHYNEALEVKKVNNQTAKIHFLP